MADLTTIILAAGKGTRMKSSLPKVLHKAGGKAMLAHVLDAAKEAGAGRSIVVVGFGGAAVEEALAGEAEFVTQAEQLGTGHAVLQTEPLLRGEKGTVLVLCGDTPLLTGTLLKKFVEEHAAAGAKATVLTAVMPDATGYGRVIRAADGTVAKIVEHKDATKEELGVREINSGIYCFSAPDLFAALHEVGWRSSSRRGKRSSLSQPIPMRKRSASIRARSSPLRRRSCVAARTKRSWRKA